MSLVGAVLAQTLNDQQPPVLSFFYTKQQQQTLLISTCIPHKIGCTVPSARSRSVQKVPSSRFMSLRKYVETPHNTQHMHGAPFCPWFPICAHTHTLTETRPHCCTHGIQLGLACRVPASKLAETGFAEAIHLGRLAEGERHQRTTRTRLYSSRKSVCCVLTVLCLFGRSARGCVACTESLPPGGGRDARLVWACILIQHYVHSVSRFPPR